MLGFERRKLDEPVEKRLLYPPSLGGERGYRLIFKNKRSELEIIGQMLTLAREDVKKTRLIYQTNLSYNHFIDYMDFLLEKGFLGARVTNPRGTFYYTTDKGKRFLESIKNVLDVLR